MSKIKYEIYLPEDVRSNAVVYLSEPVFTTHRIGNARNFVKGALSVFARSNCRSIGVVHVIDGDGTHLDTIQLESFLGYLPTAEGGNTDEQA